MNHVIELSRTLKVAAVGALVVLATACTLALPAQAADTAVMYRLYNPNSGEHFYTASIVERDAVIAAGWDDEGEGWTAPTEGVQVYRLYNSFAGEHHYTTSAEERDMLVSVGWTWEEGGWCSDYSQAVPLYRAYNPNAFANNHHYTTDWGEFQFLLSLGWQDEGIGWYGVDPDTYVPEDPDTPDYPDTPDDPYDPDIPDTPNEPDVPYIPESEQAVANVKQYSYSIRPVNGSLNNMFFVETDNPDPYSFQLVDTSSKYLEGDEEALIKPVPWNFGDVVYTNAETKRIADKGYLFYNQECDTDGGPLELKANIGYYYEDYGYGYGSGDGTNYDTGIMVSCPVLEDRVDYLIRTYAADKSDFFDKLDAVQAGLGSIALYPKDVHDTDRPNDSGYPSLAASPYPELSLNEHIDNMYESGSPLFIGSAYGFILHSTSFPGMMGAVAKKLQPDCEISSTNLHWMIDITYNGKTRDYGGAGEGSTHPIYTKFVEKTFRFDGTDQGYGTNLSMPTLKAKRLEYAAKSDEFAESSLAKLSRESVAQAVGDEAWIKIAREGLLGGGKAIGYVAYAPDDSIYYASDAWVDGRYVNENEVYEPGAKFADHPEADIILHGVTYTDKYGETHTTSVTYWYDDGCWNGIYYYTQDWGFSSSDLDKVPVPLKLTRAQVDAMVASGQIDGNTSTPPTPKYIYDGTAEPGTPCN